LVESLVKKRNEARVPDTLQIVAIRTVARNWKYYMECTENPLSYLR